MKCPHDPKTMAGRPIGMYHCPECGDTVIAGMEYPETSGDDQLARAMIEIVRLKREREELLAITDRRREVLAAYARGKEADLAEAVKLLRECNDTVTPFGCELRHKIDVFLERGKP
jgi:hypothetical protein